MFTKNKINSIWARMSDLRHFINSTFKKQTAICPFEIVRGVTNSTKAGYQPQGSQPRDFEQVIEGFDPIVTEWEDSLSFPYDGTMDQRHQESSVRKYRDVEGTKYEKEEIIPHGSVFEYEDGTEFRLDRL